MILRDAVIITDNDYWELVSLAEQVDIEVGSLWNSLGDKGNTAVLDKLRRLSKLSKDIHNKLQSK